MVKDFPVLDNYENLWPLDLLLISLLKYTSAALKGSATQKAVDAVRETVVASTSRRRRAQL
jgi:hypothetical protein